MTLGGEHGVDLARFDVAAEQVGRLTPEVPRVVGLQAPRVALEQQPGSAGLRDLLVNGARCRRQVVGEPDQLAVQRHPATSFEDERGTAQQAGRLGDLSSAASGEGDNLDAGPVTGLQGPHAQQREGALAVAQQGRISAQQGVVEVDVEGAHRAAQRR